MPSALLLAVVAVAPWPAKATEVDCRLEGPVWSQTRPPINLTHVFCGEVNRRGRPVGYHALAGERTPGEAEIVERRPAAGPDAPYEAQICVQPDEGGRPRCKRSTLFPDDWSQDEVVAAILQAWRDRTRLSRAGQWCGPSGRGFTVAGWLLPGREAINTAYPDLSGCPD